MPLVCPRAPIRPSDYPNSSLAIWSIVLLVILVWEQMPVAVHRDLQRSMAGECLHRLRREAGFDPTRNCEVPKRVPVEAARAVRSRRVLLGGLPQLVKKRDELALHQVVMTDMVALVRSEK